MAPSFEPAAIRLISRLNDTRDQSQPTLKLSLLYRNERQKHTKVQQQQKEEEEVETNMLRIVLSLYPSITIHLKRVCVVPCNYLPKRFNYLIHS